MMVGSDATDNPEATPICSGTLRPMASPALADALAVVLAHQGGWDEILMVVVPVGIFAALLRLANKRAQEQGGKGGTGKSGSGKGAPKQKGPRGPM